MLIAELKRGGRAPFHRANQHPEIGHLHQMTNLPSRAGKHRTLDVRSPVVGSFLLYAVGEDDTVLFHDLTRVAGPVWSAVTTLRAAKDHTATSDRTLHSPSRFVHMPTVSHRVPTKPLCHFRNLATRPATKGPEFTTQWAGLHLREMLLQQGKEEDPRCGAHHTVRKRTTWTKTCG